MREKINRERKESQVRKCKNKEEKWSGKWEKIEWKVMEIEWESIKVYLEYKEKVKKKKLIQKLKESWMKKQKIRYWSEKKYNES